MLTSFLPFFPLSTPYPTTGTAVREWLHGLSCQLELKHDTDILKDLKLGFFF